MFGMRKAARNVVTFLLAKTSSAKFIRTGHYKKTVGDTVGEWCLLVPLPFSPDGQEQWVAVNHFKQFAICTPINSDDAGEIIKIDDVAHFLADIKPQLGYVALKLPKVFTFEMFQSVAKDHGAKEVYEDKNENGVAIWEGECADPRVPVCYGRLLELLPNPNEVVSQKNRIQISNFKNIED